MQWNTKRLHKCAEPNSKTEYVYIGLMFKQEKHSL